MSHPYRLPGFRSRAWGLLAVLVMLLSGPVAAQTTRYRLQGRVTDANGGPLPGATVRLLNTVVGTSSDAEGRFALEASLAPGTYQLEISSVGYRPVRQPVALGAEASVAVGDAALREDRVGLNEVVVTGTSVATSKRQLGNTIATVSGDELRTAVPTQIDQALQGKFAGVQITQNSGNPAGGISVRLRGPSTVGGSSDPLYIIDGVLVNNDSPQLLDLGGYAQNRLVDISPNDIERIEVIKGAAAAAIYGSRASNGVVQIFTKRGKEGTPQVTVSSQLLVSQLRKKLDYNDYPFRFNTLGNTTDLAQTPVTRYDLQEDIFRTAIGTDDYVSVSGGSGGTRYFLSGNYFRNQGIVDNTDFGRGGGRLRLEQTLGSKARVSVGANYTLSNSQELPNGGINEAYGVLTGFIFANNYLNPAPDPNTGRYPSTAANITRTNPLEAIKRFDFQQRTSRFIGDAQLNLTPFAGFSVDYVLGYDASTQVASGFIPSGSTAPTFSTGLARRADLTTILVNNDLTFSYKRDLSETLASTTTVGGTLQYLQTFSTGVQTIGLSPGIVTTATGTLGPSGERRTERTIRGAFVQQTLGLLNRFFLTGALRVDAASVYGPSQRTQYYRKGSFSYVLSDEAFWRDGGLGRLVPQLKLRASYGEAGNLTAIDSYQRFTNYDPVVLGTLPGLSVATLQGNDNLGPERQREFEAGVDASFFGDRLGIEFSYYDKKVSDLILQRDLALSSGFLTRFDNIGNMSNRGVELLVRATPVRSAGGLTWNVTGTFTHNTNRITGIPGGLVTFPNGFGLVAAVEGRPLGTYYGTYSARRPDGTLLLTPGGLPQRERGIQGTFGRPNTPQRAADGQPSGTLLNGVLGDPNPHYVASLINEVSFKNLSLRVQFDTQQDFSVFNFTERVGSRETFGGLAIYEAELRGEKPKGTSVNEYTTFDKWVQDGSFIKLREASLSYLLKPKFLGLRDVRFSLAGRNLLVFTKYRGYDPEVNAAGQSNAVRGFDFVEVPIPRSASLGFTATF